MINTSKHKSGYQVQKGVTKYTIGFPYQYTANDEPELKILVDGIPLVRNVNYEISQDGLSVVLIPTEEQASAQGFKYDDYLWMLDWVGKKITISRDIEFVQESDYQVGRISPEQIEKDFDLSVMRDQILQGQIDDNNTEISQLFDIVAEHRADIDHAQQSANDAMAHTVAVEKRVTQAEKDIKNNDGDISALFSQQTVQDGRLSELESGKLDKDQGKINVGKVLTVGGDGVVVPKVPQGGGGSGIGVVAHDDTLVGAGTDEYPLGVKDKVTITIVEH